MKTRQLTTEDWKEIKQDNQRKRAERRSERSEIVYHLCFINEIHIEEKTEYHLRLSKEGFKSVDVYPTSSKINVLDGRNKHLTVNLDKWLQNHFKTTKH